MKDKYYWMWREEKKKREEAEGETTIVKAIGQNSPEMIALQNRVKELEQDNKIKDDELGRLYHKIKN